MEIAAGLQVDLAEKFLLPDRFAAFYRTYLGT